MQCYIVRLMRRKFLTFLISAVSGKCMTIPVSSMHTHTHKHTSQAITQNTERLHPLKPDVLCGFKACMSAFQFFFSLSLAWVRGCC